jgi:hypothetical protein
MMNRLLFATILILSIQVQAGEKLITCVVHKGSGYVAQTTEIFSVDPVSGEKKLIYSDQNSSIVVKQQLYVFHFPAIGGGKIFAQAQERGKVAPFPGNAWLYQFSIDGSNEHRGIAQVLSEESCRDISANPAGTLIAYLNRLNGKQMFFVHDVATGKLVHQVDISNTFLDCYAGSMGWFSGSDRFYFSLLTGDVDVTSDESFKRVGTYVMDADGMNMIKLPALPQRQDGWPIESARLLGIIPGNEYIFEIMQNLKNPAPGEKQLLLTIIKMNPEKGSFKDISFNPASGLYSGIQVNYQLSPSGKYLAAAALPVSAQAKTCDVWLKDLQTSTERILISAPMNGMQGPFAGLAGWINE